MDAQTSNNPATEIWQVDAGGEIYQGSLEELTQWITEGALLPQDKVRRGNLRWIEAQKVPTLLKFFNAQASGAIPPVVTINSPTPFPQAVSAPIIDLNQAKLCLVHIQTEAKFVCDGCANFFCKECPNSFGGTVKVCPMCGAMCQSLEKAIEKSRKSLNYQRTVTEGFGFTDFARAFVYPFKYPTSFIFGALFYGFFSVASQASSIGGIYLLSGSLFCWMLANMLTFGILSNVVENMLQGKLDENFMPGFDNFNLWDDAIHPLFLNISVYLSSFGLLILLCVAMFFFFTNSLKPTDSQALKAVQTAAPDAAPNFGAAQNANQQIDFFREMAEKTGQQLTKEQQEMLRQRSEQLAQEADSAESGGVKKIPPTVAYDEEAEFQQMNEMINKTRQSQLESAIGKPSEDEQMNLKGVYKQVWTWAGPFIFLAGIAFLWGIFYLPVAYIVAAYTRNVRSVFNPAIGLDTIKRLGVDYVKILLMGFILWIIAVVIGVILSLVFAPFDLPRLGNIPVIAVGSIVTFYLSIVYSIILGSALYKNSNQFPLFQTIK